MPPLRETLKKIIWNSLAPFHYTSTSFQRPDSLEGVLLGFYFFLMTHENLVQNAAPSCCCMNSQDQANNDQQADVVP